MGAFLTVLAPASMQADEYGLILGDGRQGQPMVVEQENLSNGENYTLERVLLRPVETEPEDIPVLIASPTNSPGPFPYVLLLHGRYLDKEWMVSRFSSWLASNGVASIAFDLPDHGERANDAGVTFRDNPYLFEVQGEGVKRTVRDARWVMDYANGLGDFLTNKIATMGWSIGSYCSPILLGVDSRPQGMVLNLGGTDQDVENYLQIFEPTLWDAYKPLFPSTYATGVYDSVLMLNGVNDPLVESNDAVYLYGLFPGPKQQTWYNSGHDLPHPSATDRAVDWLVDLIGTINVTNLTSSLANGTYGSGTVVSIQAQFATNYNLYVRTNSGVPYLELETGDQDARAFYSSGSGTPSLTFQFTTGVSHVSADLDVVSSNALVLNGGSITNAAGNSIRAMVPAPGAATSLGANKAIVLTGLQMIRFTTNRIVVPESAAAVTAPVVRVNGSTGTISCAWTTVASSATAGGDYTAATGTLSFTAGVTSGLATVSLSSDGSPEGNERFFIQLRGFSAGAAPGLWTNVEVIVADDDVTHTLTVTSTPSSTGSPAPNGFGSHVINGGTLVTNAVVTPFGESGGARWGCTGWTGTGDAGSGTGTTVSFLLTTNTTVNWQWRQEFLLDVGTTGSGTLNVADGWYATGSVVSLFATAGSNYQFSSWSGDDTLGRSTENPIAVTMDAAKSITASFLPGVSLSAGNTVLNEDGGGVVVTAKLTGPVSSPVTIGLALAGSASQGADYGMSLTTITIAAGSTVGTAVVSPVNDEVNEGGKVIVVSIASADGAVTSGRDSVELSLADDETPWEGGYRFRRAIATDREKVSGELPLYNFPVAIVMNGSLMRSTNVGGTVTSTNGYDIKFVQADGTTDLSYEIESYTATSGALTAWVRMPSISSASNNLFYIYYGNPAVTSANGGASSVWETNYVGVWHLNEPAVVGLSNMVHRDSTTYTNHGFQNENQVDAGKLANGQRFRGSFFGNDYVRVPDSTSFDFGTNSFSISMWVYRSFDTRYDFFSWNDPAVNDEFYFTLRSNETWFVWSEVNGNINGTLQDATVKFPTVTGTSGWFRVDFVRGPGGKMSTYINGQVSGSALNPLSVQDMNQINTGTAMRIGSGWGGTAPVFELNGGIDEVRISKTARSVDWIRTSYNNQDAPTQFSGAGIPESIWPTIRFTTNAFSVAENGGPATISLERISSTSGAVTVTYATSLGTASTADFGSITGTVTFADGAAWTSFPVVITNDVLAEQVETVLLRLTNVSAGAVLGDVTNATLSIVDNDTNHALVVSGSPAALGVSTPYGYGTSVVAGATWVTNTITSPINETSGARQACAGWTGSGSVPASGTGVVAVFVMSGPSTQVWQWVTEFQLSASAGAGGSVAASASWAPSGTTVTVEANPSAGYYFVQWTGDVPPASAQANPLVLTMDQARSVSAQFAQTAVPGGYLQRKVIRPDPGQVSGSSEHLDFPLLVSIQDPDLRTVAAGGEVALSNGYDIVFMGENGTNVLKHELERYVATNGALLAWVRVPRLRPAVDSPVYVYYGNGALTNPPGPASTVWETNFVTVWHMNDTSGTTVADSTIYTNRGVRKSSGEPASDPAGQITASLQFDGTDDSVAGSTNASVFLPGNLTVSWWHRLDGTAFYYDDRAVSRGGDGETPADNYQFSFGVLGNGGLPRYHAMHESGYGDNVDAYSTALVTTGAWAHVAVIRDVTNRTYQFVVNGVPEAALPFERGPEGSTNAGLYVGSNFDMNNNFVDGSLDEVHLARVARSADWIVTEYRNQSNPQGFVSVATEFYLDTSAGAGGSVGTPDGFYDSASPLVVTAAPAAYYSFVAWTGDYMPGTATNNPQVLTMDQPRTLAATFAANLATNGVPEWWLAQYYGVTNFNDAALSDTDGDGLAAWEEYVAGTIPVDSNSVLAVKSETRVTGGVAIQWSSETGKVYHVDRTTNAFSLYTTIASNVAANPPLNVYTDAPPATPVILYRIRVLP